MIKHFKKVFVEIVVLIIISFTFSKVSAQESTYKVIAIKADTTGAKLLEIVRQWPVSKDSCLTIHLYKPGATLIAQCKVASRAYVSASINGAILNKNEIGYLIFSGYKIFVFSSNADFYNAFYLTNTEVHIKFVDLNKTTYSDAMDVLDPAIFNDFQYYNGRWQSIK